MKRFVLALLLAALPAVAQQHPNNARGFDPEKVYQTGDIDNVNVFSGNLIVTLPIGPRFPVSETLSYGFTLVNNGNPWDYRTDGIGGEAVPSRFANAGLGWQLTLGELIGPNHPSAHQLNRQGDWVYAAPDGAERVFKRALHTEEEGTAYEGASPAQTDPGDVVGYTRDSSYLRLERLQPIRKFHGVIDPDNPIYYFVPQYRIDFPDGTRHTFTGDEYETDTLDDYSNGFYERDNRYRLTKIEDRSGNFVSVSYSTNGLTWTITDSRGRTHTVTLVRQTFYQFGGAAQQQNLVSSVKLAAPHGRTLEYGFTYGAYKTASRPCSDGIVRSGGVLTTSMRFLESVTARDAAAPTTTLATWAFVHEELTTTGGVNDCSYSAGHLKTITLPTGGQISYTAGLRLFPSDKLGTPRDQDGPDPHSISTAVRTRKVTNIDGTVAEWTYEQVQQNAGTYYDVDGIQRNANRELVVRVTDPLKRTTAHYFNINSLQIGADSCFNAGSVLDYGLPYSRTTGTNATSDLLLSQAVYPEQCVTWDNSNTCPVASPCRDQNGAAVQPVRRVYVAYDHDTISPAGAGGTGYNSRLRASRTTFLDDTGCGGVPCYTQSTSSDFDGLGHYRVETRSSNFPSTPTRTITTAYNANPAEGQYVPSGGSSPAAYMIATSSPWLLNLSRSMATGDSTGSATTSLCYSAEGLLLRRRTQMSAGGTRSDLLASFTYTGGNVMAEEYAGGDELQLPVDFSSTCTSALPAAQYRIAHGYSNGVRNSSQHDGTTFKTLDLTVDPAGVPTISRDTAGITTNYEYDVLGRPTKVQQAGEAWTEYVFTPYTSSSVPARVIVRQWPAAVASPPTGTPLTERRIYVDGAGRVLQVKTKMPDGWSTVRSRYDLLGQKVGQSMAEYRTTPDYEATFAPAHETTFTYDTFGRPTSITTPDGRTSTITYTGTRQIARTVMIGGAASWNVVMSMPIVSERNVTTTETYDGYGRLITVAENPGTPTTTSYTYDYADRLTKVTQGSQVRNFTYDSRGLLVAEQHPEKGFAGSGWIDYANYDARGHAKQRSEGSIQLTFAFDAGERMTYVYDTDGSGNPRALKEFTFGTTGNENGKLKTAKRHNRGDLGDVVVTEQYTYDGRGGRVSARQTTADATTWFNGATFTLSQTWDELGNLDTLTYPTTSLATRSLSITNGYTNGLLTSVGSYGTVSYRANGMVKTITHGSGSSSVTETWVADPSGMPRPARIEVTDANQSYWKYGDYAYDGAGNITMIGNTTYQYDDVNRLRRYVAWSGHEFYIATTYDYDRYGNRIGNWSDGCAMNGRCFASLPSHVPIATSSNHINTHSYDDSGSITSDGKYNFAYDATAMMTSLTGTDRDERYLYTAGDERLAVVRNAGAGRRTTWTIRALDNRLLRTWTDDTTTGSRQFTWSEDEIWRGGNVLASDSPTGLKRYHLDHLGSPRLVTNNIGIRIGEQPFDPFGSGGTLDGGRLQFTAHERDVPESGKGLVLDYMHARYYDGGAGRFLTVDPVMDVARNMAEPQRWNRYSYVTNNPMRYDDPDGRERRILLLSFHTPSEMRLPLILEATPAHSKGIDSGYSIDVRHSLGGKALLHALRDVDNSGTDIAVINSHGGKPLQTDTGGGADGSRRFNFGAADIAKHLGGRPQAIVLAGCATMDSAQAVANATGTTVFGIRSGAESYGHQISRAGTVLANVYAATGNAQFAMAVANKMLKRHCPSNGGSCSGEPAFQVVHPARSQ